MKIASQRTILVVDDDPDSVRVVSHALKWAGYEVCAAANATETHQFLADGIVPDLVLLDVNLPGVDGISLLKELRSRYRYVAVIFISGDSAIESVTRGLDSGADDYVTKPFDPRELLARVRSQLRIRDLTDQLRDANEKLKELVDTDDLTGLYNMRSLYQKLDSELSRARRFGRAVCVVMMDIDRFKSVNDSHDHLFGSYVLAEVGTIIRQSIRHIDLAARYGGDEFLIVLTETSAEGARIFCERLREAIEKRTFAHGLDKIRLTASLGFAITSQKSEDDSNPRNLVRAADTALYEAKRSGRNCVRQKSLDQEPVIDFAERKALRGQSPTESPAVPSRRRKRAKS